MPKKVRELKRPVSKAGFELLPDRGKGSHTVWRHPLLDEDITIPGKDGSDARPYLERQVLRALKRLELMEDSRRMKTQYSMVIEWSEEDQAYLVTIPEFVGRVMMPCTDGETYAEAAKHGQEVIETFVELWQDEGKALPEPRVRQVA